MNVTTQNFTAKLPPMTIAKPINHINVASTIPAKKTTKTTKTKKIKRCQLEGCKKKLSIAAFDCRCEKRFCNLHTSAENHDCTFDYKSFHRKNLVDKLVGGVADKVGYRV